MAVFGYNLLQPPIDKLLGLGSYRYHDTVHFIYPGLKVILPAGQLRLMFLINISHL